MFETRHGRERGMVMILVLVLVALLLIVALAVITGSNNAALSATAVSVKYRVLNSAEGGANSALDDLAQNPAEADNKHLAGSLNGAQWDAYIRVNNLLSNNGATYYDPVTGKKIDVPAHAAYLYGYASDSDTGGHKTYVEAIAVPGPPLTLPSGVINAGRDILDLAPMAINSDPLDKKIDDADVHANNNITGQLSTVVQGATFAVGSDDLMGAAGRFPNSPAVSFPSASQISQTVRTANLSALAGTVLTPAQIAQNGTHTYSGNVYIGGDLDVGSNAVTFSGGKYVYVDGNLCLTANGGQVNDFNSIPNEIVVAGNVEVAGGTYGIIAGQNTLMIVLGNDDNSTTPCAGQRTNAHAVDFATVASLPSPIGTIYAANGSIEITGPGAVAGVLDAGTDIRILGTNQKLGMQYDLQQANTTMNTGTLTYESYIEY
jgi:hypothetical protein